MLPGQPSTNGHAPAFAPVNGAPVVPAQQQQQYQLPAQPTNQPVYPPAPQMQGQPQWAQQQVQPQQMQQPVQQQPQQQLPEPMPLVAPNPRTQQPQPVQQQQQPAPQQQQGFDTNAMYTALSQALGVSPEYARQVFQDNPQTIATTIAQAVRLKNQAEQQQQQVPLPTQQQQQQQQQQGIPGEIQIPEAAYYYLRKENGMWQPANPAYQQYANAANHNEMLRQQRVSQMAANPASLLDDQGFNQKFNEKVQQAAQQLLQGQQVSGLRAQVREKYKSAVCMLNPDGSIKYGMNNEPVMTPLGMAFQRHAERLQTLGMRESAEYYDEAFKNACLELGMYQQPQQQMQQQVQGLPQQLFQQQPQQGMQPVQQANGYQQAPDFSNMLQQGNAMLQQNRLQQNSYWPANAPARSGQVPNLTPEAALAEALANEPEGMDANFYFNRVGSLFGSGSGR